MDGQPARSAPAPTLSLPINLGLNDGTYCPQGCVEALRSFQGRTSLRNYTSSDNAPLRQAIAEADGVAPEHVFLANGSGPLLKLWAPWLIEQQVRRSPLRIARHLLRHDAYPILTPRFTYFKVPLKAIASGIKVRLLPMGPENGFRLDPDLLQATLEQGDALVYLASPNNPTGKVLITRERLVPLLEAFPGSLFWLDEAYVQYLDPARHRPLSDLVPSHPNLVITRTFSFAYGLAGARIGYLLARPDWVEQVGGRVTDYRLGALQERLALAALRDSEHLDFVRRETRAAVDFLRDAFERYDFIQTWDSDTNFFLARFTDGRPSKPFAEALLAEGVKIKTFTNFLDATFDEYFRITIGIPEENRFLARKIAAVLGPPPGTT